jgi:hypothetical protein
LNIGFDFNSIQGDFMVEKIKVIGFSNCPLNFPGIVCSNEEINECTDQYRYSFIFTDLNGFFPKLMTNGFGVSLESKIKNDLVAFNSDEVFFIHKKLSGDGNLITKISDIVESNEFSRGGLMIRDSNQNAGKMFQCSITFSKNPIILYRTISSTTKTISKFPSVASWIKLERKNNVNSCYYSNDSFVWTKYGISAFIYFSNDIYVGLYQNGANASSIGKVTFTNTTFSGFNGICSNRGSCNPMSHCICPVGFTGIQCESSFLQNTATLLCNSSCTLNLTDWSLCNVITGPNCYCNQTSTIQTSNTNIKCSNDSEITEL